MISSASLSMLVLVANLAHAQRPYAQVYAEAARNPLLTSLIVSQNGRLVRDEYFHGLKPGQSVNVKSVSKSILSALVGIAIAEGRFKETDRVSELMPDEFRHITDPRKRALTVRDFLSMTTGLESTSFNHYGAYVNSRNWVKYQLDRPLVCAPGTCMTYSTGASHVLSVLLTRKTGMSTRAYARKQLFAPLGIKLAGWSKDPQGYDFGGNEMRFTPRDLLKFGELYRMAGRHDGKQLVPAEWIRKSWGEYATSPWNGHRYGYLWWTREHAGMKVHFAWGYGGQFVFVVPEKQLVVVTTSALSRGRDPRHLGNVHALVDRIVEETPRSGD